MANNYDIKDAGRALKLARVSMLFNFPFFGNLAMKLRLVEVKDESKNSMFKTAAVDGRNLYYNTDFIMRLDEKERIFLVAHEVLHCVFSHLTRRFDREPQIFNMACDYVINAMLIEHGLQMPKIGLHDSKYLGWAAEDVYDDLIKNNVKAKPTLDHHAGDPGFPGKGEANGKGKGKGNSDGKGKSGEGEGDGGEKGDAEGLGDELTEEEKKELESYWKDNLAQAAASVGAGNVPAGLKRLIDDFLDPKMDWREMIQIHVQSCVRNDYTWMKPNKRTFGQGITMPSMEMDDGIEIAVAIDTSGSVSEEMLREFLSEIKGIMEQFSGHTIHIACFDTEVYNPRTFTEHDDLMDYELAGFGGTDFMAWWKFALNEPWIGDISKILFFTDGYPCGEWGEDNVCDTLWIIHGGTNEGPFGQTVFYDDQ